MVKVKYDFEKKEWITLEKGSPEGMYIDGYLKDNLDLARKIIRDDWDMMFCYDGYEGSGKSVKAMQDASFCSPETFNIDNICFNPKEFRRGVLKAKAYDSVVYDEAYTGLSSRATMGMINRTLVSMLAEIRQKNLFVFIVMPTFFDLDRYVALWRSRALINVYTDKFQRGYFAFYNMDRKKQLFVNGKKTYEYSKPYPNFRGRFMNYYPVDEKEYRKRKKDALNARENQRIDIEVKKELENELFERVFLMDEGRPEEKKMTHQQKIEILGLTPSVYFYKLKQYKEMREIT